MVYDFQNSQNAPELTLHAARTYIWSLTPESAKYLYWIDVCTESEHEKALDWINSLRPDPGAYLDALRACLLVFSVSDGRVVPREFQLTSGLEAFWGKHTIINAGTGSGKTLSMVIPLLMDPEAVAIIISPLKRLQITQAEELERFLIKPLVINQDTDLTSLQIQHLKTGAYNAIIVSPEQFFPDPSSGAIPWLLGLLKSNHACLRSVKHVYIDEGHELFFSGMDRHNIPAFRPSYGNLDKVLPKLPNRTTVHVLSATLPPHVTRVIEAKLFRDRERTHIRLPLNRRNIVYATRAIKDLGEYKNLSFLIPHHNPSSRPTGVIIFFESSVRADDAANYLNNTFHAFHPTHKSSQIAASYHAKLSQTYLTRVFQQFCGTHESGERIDILCTTSCGATGIDYPNVTVVIQYGMCPSLCSLIQRAGRAARAPGTSALFIYMVEDWVKGEEVDQRSATYLKDPDTPVRPVRKGKKDKQWVGMASVAFANSTSCLRVEFTKYLGDESGDHAYSTNWCCDRHNEDIDFTSFGLSDFWDGTHPIQYQFIPVTYGPEGEDRKRKGGDCKKVIKILMEWRQRVYYSDPISIVYDIQDIITEDGIGLVAKISPSRLYRDGPETITKELKETVGWGTQYARWVFECLWRHDHDDSSQIPTYAQS